MFPVSLSRSIIRDSSGNEVAVVGIVRDISERILVEDELRSLNQELEKQNRLKSELAVMVSEVLRILLAALKDIVQDAKAEDNITQAEKVVSEFLDIAKIDTGEIKLEQTKRKLEPLVSEVMQALLPLTAEK